MTGTDNNGSRPANGPPRPLAALRRSGEGARPAKDAVEGAKDKIVEPAEEKPRKAFDPAKEKPSRD